MRAILISSAILAAIFLAACGSSREDPREWKQQFTLQVREDIEATKRVGKSIQSANSPFDIQRRYEIYAAEMVVAEERLEALDSAPNGCGDAVRLVLRVVRDGSFAGATFNQKSPCQPS